MIIMEWKWWLLVVFTYQSLLCTCSLIILYMGWTKLSSLPQVIFLLLSQSVEGSKKATGWSLKEVLNIIQLLLILTNLIHQRITWLTWMFMTIFVEWTSKASVRRIDETNIAAVTTISGVQGYHLDMWHVFTCIQFFNCKDMKNIVDFK